MKEIIINDHNIEDGEIEMEVIRVKGLILNSKGKIFQIPKSQTQLHKIFQKIQLVMIVLLIKKQAEKQHFLQCLIKCRFYKI